jgi:hypothetical protein
MSQAFWNSLLCTGLSTVLGMRFGIHCRCGAVYLVARAALPFQGGQCRRVYQLMHLYL